ncbi:uncharacterized protein PFL1_04334 [Pseudozyma flocculosa PF-1]|uniref:AB hydrolase-1 domain-containing protein n=2 Tax=Pseudozyma flocculosa TaxID=84751 RepID=A0A5C3FB01_9BASI|nr:uncharacterized protein PFL1_04334 [Pseudozyma flocculosa PF-1]EPQ28007.1 hypothetical protein PFL1_04334 [Pseudozyma flocculosa PF-1]SPO41602.1 uncharacterized protein PSFLO_07084 [Pseudozyma flocculosa]
MVQTQHFTTSDGAVLGYRIHAPLSSSSSSSSAVPLVLINGLSAVMEHWSPLVESLAESRKVLIFDHRGIGASTVPDDWDHDLTIESMGLDLVALLASIGWTKVDLLGFSMGGHITQALISIEEGKKTSGGGVEVRGVEIRKAVLTATMTKLPHGDADLQAIQNAAAKIKGKQERDLYITTEMMRLQYHADALRPGTELYKKFEDRIQVSLGTRQPAEIIASQFFAIQGCDVRKQLHRIPSTLPVLVIHGHRDRMVSYSESDYIVKGIPHARRFVPPQGSEFAHFWYDYFDTRTWSRAITSFLDDDNDAASRARL